MAELKAEPGTRLYYAEMGKARYFPRHGRFSVTDVAEYLGIRPREVRRLLATLGIQLGPLVRTGQAVRKAMPRGQHRFLEPEEARQVLELHFLREGERVQRQLQRLDKAARKSERTGP